MRRISLLKSVIALLLCVCVSACNIVPPSESVPNESMSPAESWEQTIKEAKIYFGRGDDDYDLDGDDDYDRDIDIGNWTPLRDEGWMTLCTDIIIGTVGEYTLSAHYGTEETDHLELLYGNDELGRFAGLLVDFEIEQVLWGDFKEGDQISLFQRAVYLPYTNVLCPATIGGDLAGGFLQQNEKVLLFVVRFQNEAFIEFHKDHPYEIVECGYGLHYGRTVNEDGALGYRMDNIYANMGRFAGCKTVQEMRDRIIAEHDGY